MNRNIPSLCVILLLMISARVCAFDIWVSPAGSDRAAGTQAAPRKTLTAALRQARELRRTQPDAVKGGITIYLTRVNMPFTSRIYPSRRQWHTRFTHRHTTTGTPVAATNAAVQTPQAILSGGVSVSGWKKSKGKLWVADVPCLTEHLLRFANYG
jgi:hypothetical protein